MLNTKRSNGYLRQQTTKKTTAGIPAVVFAIVLAAAVEKTVDGGTWVC
jgi:hypothetical protein